MDHKNPIIAIGGLGGSGTRAVAEVFIQAGLFMGDELNKSNDTLVFTRLFKNPAWYRKSSQPSIEKRLGLFRKYMASDRLSLVEALQMASAFYSNPIKKSVPEVYRRLFGRMFKRPTKPVRWGWKEPNTHIYLDELLAGIPDLKYIYVIRNGIDMAFSRNLQQLKNWGWKFGIHVDQDEAQESLSAKQLEYWIRSNRRVIEIAAKYPDRCLLLNFPDFCNYPMQQIDRLLDFAGLVIDNTQKKVLYQIPDASKSSKKYTANDLRLFRPDQLEALQEWGFDI